MPVTDVQQDLDNLTLTITAEFAAPVARIWQVYADPRQLEKVWGPPTYPATVVDHDLVPGGRTTYFMTGPEGDKHAGYWEITAVDEPTSFSFDDGFADLDFNPNPELPVVQERLHLRRARRRHPCDLREHLRIRRGAPAGAGHGRGRGRVVGDQPDRRPGRRLNHIAGQTIRRHAATVDTAGCAKVGRRAGAAPPSWHLPREGRGSCCSSGHYDRCASSQRTMVVVSRRGQIVGRSRISPRYARMADPFSIRRPPRPTGPPHGRARLRPRWSRRAMYSRKPRGRAGTGRERRTGKTEWV